MAAPLRFPVFDPPADPAAPGEGPPAWALIRLACVSYGSWQLEHAAAARRMLAADPSLASADVFAAATVGDVAAVRGFLAADPAAASTRGGPFGWEPILYACYSRLDSDAPGHDPLAVVGALLDAGATADVGFHWAGNTPAFTALTGAFGEGENGSNQPPHRQRDALARRLLEAGADPADEQALYNRHFNPADDHLVLLFAFGLGAGGERHQALLTEELWCAAKKNYQARAELLLRHGTEVDRPGRRDGRTPYQVAMLAGNRELAATLVARGARAVALSPVDALAAACMAGRRDELDALRARDPDLIASLGRHTRVAMVHRAVEADRPDGVRLLAELGFELSGMTEHDGAGLNLATTPLHNAAWSGNLAMVQLLVELGADPDARDRTYDATPLGWAEHNHQAVVSDWLRRRPWEPGRG